MINNNLIIKEIALNGGRLYDHGRRMIGVSGRNHLVDYDVERCEVSAHIDTSRPPEVSAGSESVRVVSNKGAVFYTMEIEEYSGGNSFSLFACDIAHKDQYIRIPLGNIIDWNDGYSVADAVKLSDDIIIIALYKDAPYMILLVEYSIERGACRIIDIAESKTREYFCNLELSESGECFTVDLAYAKKYLFFDELQTYRFSICGKREYIRIASKDEPVEYTNWFANHGFSEVIINPILKSKGEYIIRRNKNKTNLLNIPIRRASSIVTQPFDSLDLMLVLRKDAARLNFYNCQDDQMMLLNSVHVGDEPIEMHYCRSDNNLLVYAGRKTFLIYKR